MVSGMRNGSEISVSVVIPVYNGQVTIAQCLEAVYASTLPDDVSNFEVIVVDDHSTDDTPKIVQNFPCLLISCPQNCGPAAARNLGASHASGNILYFLDADILLTPDTLARVLKAFDLRPGLSGLFGSFQKNTGPDNFVSVYKNYLHYFTHQNSSESAATFCGGFGAIRREAFFEVGGFDPALRFLEDVELGCRLHASGHSIWLIKDLQSTHLKRYSFASLVRTDLLGRAIPWTRIMLEARIFRNDLNTQTHNIASVPVSFAALLAPLLWLMPDSHAGTLLALLAMLFLTLNRGFLLFTWRERGPLFASGAALMSWFGYLYSGVGVFAGVLSHFQRSIRPEPSSRPPLTAKAAVPCEDHTQ